MKRPATIATAEALAATIHTLKTPQKTEKKISRKFNEKIFDLKF